MTGTTDTRRRRVPRQPQGATTPSPRGAIAGATAPPRRREEGGGGFWVPCAVPYEKARDAVGPVRHGAGGWFLGTRRVRHSRNGGKVEVRFDDGTSDAFHPAEVVDLQEETVDGVKCWVFASSFSSSDSRLAANKGDVYCQLEPAKSCKPLQAGDEVYGLYQNNAEMRYYRGRVYRCTDTHCSIAYDDGDVESNVPYCNIRSSSGRGNVLKVVARACPSDSSLAWLDGLTCRIPSKQRPELLEGTVSSLPGDTAHKVLVVYAGGDVIETRAAAPIVRRILDDAVARCKVKDTNTLALWPRTPTATGGDNRRTKHAAAAAATTTTTTNNNNNNSIKNNDENGRRTAPRRKISTAKEVDAKPASSACSFSSTGPKKAPLATVYFDERRSPPQSSSVGAARAVERPALAKSPQGGEKTPPPLPLPTPAIGSRVPRRTLRPRAALNGSYRDADNALDRDLEALLRDPDSRIPYSAPRRKGRSANNSSNDAAAVGPSSVSSDVNTSPAAEATATSRLGQRQPPAANAPAAAVTSPCTPGNAADVRLAARPSRRGCPSQPPAPPIYEVEDDDFSSDSDGMNGDDEDEDYNDWDGDAKVRPHQRTRPPPPPRHTASGSRTPAAPSSTTAAATTGTAAATTAIAPTTAAGTSRNRKRGSEATACEIRRPPTQRRRPLRASDTSDRKDKDENSNDEDESVAEVILEVVEEETCSEYVPHEPYVHPAPEATEVHLMPTTLSDKFHKALTSSATKWASDLARLVHGFHRRVPTDDCLTSLLTFLCRGPRYNGAAFPDPCMVDFVKDYVYQVASEPGMAHHLAQRLPEQYWNMCLQQVSDPYYTAPGDEGRTNHHAFLRQGQSLHAKGACVETFHVLLRSQVDACVAADDPSSLLETLPIVGDLVRQRRGPKAALEQFVRASARLWIHHGHLWAGDVDLTRCGRSAAVGADDDRHDQPSEHAVRAAQRSSAQLFKALGQVCTQLAWVYRTAERESVRCVAGVMAHAFGGELRESSFDPSPFLERQTPERYRECLKLEFVESLGRDLVPQLRPYVAQGLGIVALWNELHGSTLSKALSSRA